MKKDSLERWKSVMSDVHEHILNNCDPSRGCGYFNKGFLVVDDDKGVLDFVKNSLEWADLVSAGKVNEITIDDSWNNVFKKTKTNIEGNYPELWNKLVVQAYIANHGLLVVNIQNIEALKHCWHLKKLVKQENKLSLCPMIKALFGQYGKKEYSLLINELKNVDGLNLDENSFCELIKGFTFDGYVLFVLKGISWEEARDYAKRLNSTDYDNLMLYTTRICEL